MPIPSHSTANNSQPNFIHVSGEMVMLASLGKEECRAAYDSGPSEPWSFFSNSSLQGKAGAAEKLN
jgi:hypothetical protein